MSLIPPVSINRSADTGQLPRTGFPFGWVTAGAVLLGLIGLYLVGVKKKWAS